jgi:phosphonate transport system substrate-binding protein
MFIDVNEDDARAAMKVYTQVIADDNKIPVNSDALILDGPAAIGDALRQHKFDMLSLTAEEFFSVQDQGLDGPLLLAVINHSVSEEYVLLARRNSPVQKVEDLPGRRLILSSDQRSSLAPLWLELLCHEHGLPPASEVFSARSSASKPTLVLLPVFFGKADVCITTRNTWLIMGELNPQVTNQLCAIAQSPPVIPGWSCFRRGVPEPLKQHLIKVALESSEKLSFRQLMSLFKTDKLEVQPLSVLAGTRDLVAKYHALGKPAPDGTAAPPAAGEPAKEEH